ncbi:MAG: sodium:proton antiporter [Oscillospiraceae bacterium]|nr:sodium:proton antiporter [Oscillospiraceae bacterium]
MIQRILENRFSVTAVILFGIGFANLMLQYNLVKKVVGFNIMDSAVFLLLASQGYIEGAVPPIVAEGAIEATAYINPIPSGLVLTGIVVSVSVSAFSLALIQRIYHKYGTVDLRELVMRTEKEED